MSTGSYIRRDRHCLLLKKRGPGPRCFSTICSPTHTHYAPYSRRSFAVFPFIQSSRESFSLADGETTMGANKFEFEKRTERGRNMDNFVFQKGRPCLNNGKRRKNILRKKNCTRRKNCTRLYVVVTHNNYILYIVILLKQYLCVGRASTYITLS